MIRVERVADNLLIAFNSVALENLETKSLTEVDLGFELQIFGLQVCFRV